MSLYILEGLRPWVIQRVSAVYIVLFLFYASYSFFSAEVISYDVWRFVISLLFHAWIGMRDVVLDYVHNIMLRIFVLALLIGVLFGSGLWVFRILLLSVVN